MGNYNLDLNTSNHFPQGVTCVSFITDDLKATENRLKAANIPYDGPKPSHLGMTCIQFKDPDGYLIKVNTPGSSSNE